MWQRLPAFIREWPILIVGILLIVPLLYFSSYEASSSKSTASAPSLSRPDESASRPTAATCPSSKRRTKFISRTSACENHAEFRASPGKSAGYVA